MKIGSNELIRDINSKLILDTIIKNQPISRASISKELGLTKATVSTIVQELINQHLIIEIGCDDTSLGRKPILLSFHKKAGYVISLDIGVHIISALVTDLAAEDCILKRISTPRSGSTIVTTIGNMISSIQDTLPPSPYGLVSIAIGIHGITSDNRIHFTPYYDLSDQDLCYELEKCFHIPIHLENEANLSVIAEHTFLYDAPNIANLNIHSGIGVGILMNHQLYTGDTGLAGEFGHMIIALDGRPCPCGNRGCLEQYLSEQALMNDFAKQKNLPSCTFHEFVQYYQKGDDDATAILSQFVKYIVICINNILNTLNPSIIIINSHFTMQFPWLVEEIKQGLVHKLTNQIQIVNSTLNDTSILLGGISVGIKDFLNLESLHLLPPSNIFSGYTN